LEVVRGSAQLKRSIDHPVLTIGNFDGIHLGHRQILRTVVEQANALGGEPMVYTFDPHPRAVLYPERAPKRIITLDQKLELLAASGIEVVIIEPFTREFARTPPEVFVRKYVHENIHPRKVYVGYDFHFGKDREGSMRLLTELGPALGFEVTIVSEVRVSGSDVNSTRIRGLLSEGKAEETAVLLDRPYAIRGLVVQGDQRGRQLGFPTANLDSENEILPREGVYVGEARFLEAEPVAGRGRGDRDRYPAVVNIGRRPTFDRGEQVLVEAHLLDFEGELYGRRIEIAFFHRLRDEKRFSNVEALKKQIARDVEAARNVLLTNQQQP